MPARYHTGINLSGIQQAIEALPEEQQASLAVWLTQRDRLQWDTELEHDFSPSGAGDALLDRIREHGPGRVKADG